MRGLGFGLSTLTHPHCNLPIASQPHPTALNRSPHPRPATGTGGSKIGRVDSAARAQLLARAGITPKPASALTPTPGSSTEDADSDPKTTEDADSDPKTPPSDSDPKTPPSEDTQGTKSEAEALFDVLAGESGTHQ